MNRTRIIPALVAALCAVCGCSSKPSAEAQPQVRLTFRSVQDPIHELCIDDTYHRTHYFTGPLVRFEHSTITLNGSPSSAEKLLDWAKERTRARQNRRCGCRFHPTACSWQKMPFCRLCGRCRTSNCGKSIPILAAERDRWRSRCLDARLDGIVGITSRCAHQPNDHVTDTIENLAIAALVNRSTV
jgi:hypothetical protein